MKYKFTKSVYIEPYEGNYIVYAPLKKLAFTLKKNPIELIQKLNDLQYQMNEQEIHLYEFLQRQGLLNETEESDLKTTTGEFLPTSLYLLLTSNCNLRCLYCYSNGGETNINLPLNISKAAIDIIINNAKKTGQNARLQFHGGGEPTLRWNDLVMSCEYFRSQSTGIMKKSIVGLNTNGVLSRNQTEWISQNIDEITISLDGIGAVHDLQRPMRNGNGTFGKVWDTLVFLNNKKRKTSIRVTITKNNYLQMKDMVDALSQFDINGIEFEPLSICGRGIDKRIDPPSSDEYLLGFKEAYDKAKEKNVKIIYSGVRLGTVSNIFCGAAGKNFAVTPSGHATFCHRVSHPSDINSSQFFYGKYHSDLKTFVFDYEKIHLMRNLNCQSANACKNCILKWNCGGGCYAQNLTENGSLLLENPSPRCSITKFVGVFQIAKKLGL